MNKKLLIALSIFFLSLVLLYIYFPRYNSETEQWSFKQKNYWRYNVPEGFLFSSLEDNLDYKKLNFQVELQNCSQNMSNFLKNKNQETLNICYLGKISEDICIETQEPPIELTYFSRKCGIHRFFLTGCSEKHRKAIICGDTYYVIDFDSVMGPRYFGPFKIGEKPKLIATYTGEDYYSCINEGETICEYEIKDVTEKYNLS